MTNIRDILCQAHGRGSDPITPPFVAHCSCTVSTGFSDSSAFSPLFFFPSFCFSPLYLLFTSKPELKTCATFGTICRGNRLRDTHGIGHVFTHYCSSEWKRSFFKKKKLSNLILYFVCSFFSVVRDELGDLSRLWGTHETSQSIWWENC